MTPSDHSPRRGPSPAAEFLHEAVFVPFDHNVARRILGFLAPYRATVAGALLCILIYTLVQVGIPATVRLAIDSAVGDLDVGLGVVMAGFAALIALSAVFGFLQEWVAARLAQRIIFDLRRAMFAHVQDISLLVLDQTQVGRLMSRLQGDVGALQEFFENSVSAIGDLLLLVGIVTMLLVMDWQLGLLTLAVLPALVWVRSRWVPWARQAFVRSREASSAVNAALAENINGIRTVQESRREALNLSRYALLARENLLAQQGSARAAQVMVPAVDVLTGVALAVIIVLGGARVQSGALGVGVMVAFIFYVQRFFDPIRTLSMQYTVMQRAMAAGRRIFEVLDVPLTLTERADAVSPGRLKSSIEFRNVVFGYRNDHAVLHDVSFAIEPRQTVALVGPTGSGKTSITALIQRFHDVWGGQVLIGGHDVRDLQLSTLRRTIGIVHQEPYLFSGSVAENIRYGAEDASMDEVIQAAKAVSAHDFIVALPDGYDTVLGQRGSNLSAGQRQLLSFARTMLANPDILILDEATAHVDSFTERNIQQGLRLLSRNRTTLIIAHRLSTVRNADHIIVLDNGRIREQGTHSELLDHHGAYALLYESSQSGLCDLMEEVQGCSASIRKPVGEA